MDQNMVSLRINDIPVTVPAGTTVLEAARDAGINIPSLCYLKGINEIGACRICVVEVKGARSLMASCVYPVSEGMEVKTNTPRVRHSRQLSLELILSNHRMDCLTCSRNAQCELRQLAADLGIDAVRYANDELLPRIEDTALHLLSHGLAHLIASDAHDDRFRTTGFRSLLPVLEPICPPDYIALLLHGNPRRILRDEPIPIPPLQSD